MTIEIELLHLFSLRFKQAFARIAGATNQLNDQQMWQRPSSKSNSIGIILQHLTGNLNQWVCDALGGRAYKRNRPVEFEDTKKASKNEMAANFSALGNDVQDVLSKISPDILLSPRHIQGSDETVLSALFATLTHLELHAGQITCAAKLLLNEKYVENKG